MVTLRDKIAQILKVHGPLQVIDITKYIMEGEHRDFSDVTLRGKRWNTINTVLSTYTGNPFVKGHKAGLYGLPEHHLQNGSKMQELEHSCLEKLVKLMVGLGTTADRKVAELNITFSKAEDDYIVNMWNKLKQGDNNK